MYAAGFYYANSSYRFTMYEGHVHAEVSKDPWPYGDRGGVLAIPMSMLTC